MEFNPVQPDILKYEIRGVANDTAGVQAQKKKGGFSRFMSGIGRFFGAIAAPLAFVFPPAAIASAGFYGLSQVGDMGQAKAAAKMQANSAPSPSASQGYFFPGMDLTPGPTADAGKDMSSTATSAAAAQKDRIMNVLYARNDLMMANAQQMKGTA